MFLEKRVKFTAESGNLPYISAEVSLGRSFLRGVTGAIDLWAMRVGETRKAPRMGAAS